MNDQQRAAMRLALEAFDLAQALLEQSYHHPKILSAYKTMREASAQPQGEWVDLTDDEIEPLLQEWWNLPCDTVYDVSNILRSVIAKFKEKNTPAQREQQEPVAWVESLDNTHPRFVTNLKYCSAHEVENGLHLKYIPLYTTPPSVEAAIEATKEKPVRRCAKTTQKRV